MYPDANIDRAIQLAADEWLRITKATRTLGTLQLTAGSYTLPAAPTGWLPEYHLQQALTLSGFNIDPTIDFVGYDDVLLKQAQYGVAVPPAPISTPSPQGRPYLFGYQSTSSGICWPTPDLAYVINLWYWQPFTVWSPGNTPSPDSFNLPDDHLRVIATLGTEAYIQNTEPENAGLAESAMKRFEDTARKFAARGAGYRGGNVATKGYPTNYRAGYWPVVPYIPRG